MLVEMTSSVTRYSAVASPTLQAAFLLEVYHQYCSGPLGRTLELG